MWKVIEGFCGDNRKFCVVNDDFDFYESDGEIYSTPYRIEAQQIADELNGESNASN